MEKILLCYDTITFLETSHLVRVIYSRSWRKLVQVYCLKKRIKLQLLPSSGSSTAQTLGSGGTLCSFSVIEAAPINKMLKYSLDKILERKGMALQ